MTLRLSVALILLAPAVSPAQAPAEWAEFTRAFKAYADSDQVVGASVVLMKNGRVAQRRMQEAAFDLLR